MFVFIGVPISMHKFNLLIGWCEPLKKTRYEKRNRNVELLWEKEKTCVTSSFLKIDDRIIVGMCVFLFINFRFSFYSRSLCIPKGLFQVYTILYMSSWIYHLDNLILEMIICIPMWVRTHRLRVPFLVRVFLVMLTHQ